MISTSNKPDSESLLMETIHMLADAGGSVIQVRTREPMRAALVLRKHFVCSDTPYKEWDVVNGFRVFTRENFTDNRIQGGGQDFLAGLSLPLEQLRDPRSPVSAETNKIHYFVFINPQAFIRDNPLCLELIQQYAAILPSTNVCTIFVTPEMALPDVAVGTVLVADLTTPNSDELQAVLLRSIQAGLHGDSFKGSDASEDDIVKIANMGLGLSLYEFETYAAIAMIEGGKAGEKTITRDRLMSGIAKGKTAIVRQSEILELSKAEDISNIGGMDNLKEWLAARAGCYSDHAKEFGIEPPKGMVLVGTPGTGKSLAAKVTASVLEVPLVKLDFGRVFSKYVGDSESRVRAALTMVENMAPVVLFVDEIDKGLGGAGGGGDSGTSSRVLGSFLTWLQECTAPVFTVVTANRVDGLPPELLRRGRFDQVFSVGMPNDDERREVLAIHLRKRNRGIDVFSAGEIGEFLAASRNYVPAEIESAVKDALIASYNEPQEGDVEMRHIITALKSMVPMSVAHKESIDRIVAWAANHATPVSKPKAIPAIGESGGARILRNRPRA